MTKECSSDSASHPHIAMLAWQQPRPLTCTAPAAQQAPLPRQHVLVCCHALCWRPHRRCPGLLPRPWASLDLWRAWPSEAALAARWLPPRLVLRLHVGGAALTCLVARWHDGPVGPQCIQAGLQAEGPTAGQGDNVLGGSQQARRFGASGSCQRRHSAASSTVRPARSGTPRAAMRLTRPAHLLLLGRRIPARRLRATAPPLLLHCLLLATLRAACPASHLRHVPGDARRMHGGTGSRRWLQRWRRCMLRVLQLLPHCRLLQLRWRIWGLGLLYGGARRAPKAGLLLVVQRWWWVEGIRSGAAGAWRAKQVARVWDGGGVGGVVLVQRLRCGPAGPPAARRLRHRCAPRASLQRRGWLARLEQLLRLLLQRIQRIQVLRAGAGGGWGRPACVLVLYDAKMGAAGRPLTHSSSSIVSAPLRWLERQPDAAGDEVASSAQHGAQQAIQGDRSATPLAGSGSNAACAPALRQAF